MKRLLIILVLFIVGCESTPEQDAQFRKDLGEAIQSMGRNLGQPAPQPDIEEQLMRWEINTIRQKVDDMHWDWQMQKYDFDF